MTSLAFIVHPVKRYIYRSRLFEVSRKKRTQLDIWPLFFFLCSLQQKYIDIFTRYVTRLLFALRLETSLFYWKAQSHQLKLPHIWFLFYYCQVRLTVLVMVIWVVVFSREGYKIRYNFDQKSISSKKIIVFCELI